jgi:hypothetical protein
MLLIVARDLLSLEHIATECLDHPGMRAMIGS